MRLLESIKRSFGLINTVGVIAAFPFLWKRIYCKFIQQKRDDIEVASKKTVISLVITVFNANDEALDTCIQSILKQTYTNWELCICSELPSISMEVRRTLERYRGMDERVRVIFLTESVTSCELIHIAAEQASGDFIGEIRPLYALKKDMIERIVNVILLNQSNIDYLHVNYHNARDFKLMKKTLFWHEKGFLLKNRNKLPLQMIKVQMDDD